MMMMITIVIIIITHLYLKDGFVKCFLNRDNFFHDLLPWEQQGKLCDVMMACHVVRGMEGSAKCQT